MHFLRTNVVTCQKAGDYALFKNKCGRKGCVSRLPAERFWLILRVLQNPRIAFAMRGFCLQIILL